MKSLFNSPKTLMACLFFLCSRFLSVSPLFWLLFLRLLRAKQWIQKHGFIATTRRQTLNWNIFMTVVFPLCANSVLILFTTFSCPNFQSICNVHHFLKCRPCILAHGISVDGHPIPLGGFFIIVNEGVHSFRTELGRLWYYLDWYISNKCFFMFQNSNLSFRI